MLYHLNKIKDQGRMTKMAEEKAIKKKENEERLESAKENLDKIQKKIRPYIRKNDIEIRSTAGKWSDGKSLTRQEFFNVLERVTKPLSQDDKEKA